MSAATVLVVNAGSSSLKLRLLDGDNQRLAERDGSSAEAPDQALATFLKEVPVRPDLIAHRVVHGGLALQEPVVVTREIEAELEQVIELAPLHNALALAAIRAAESCAPGIPNVACFDTAFHRTLPAEASTYALPSSWLELGPLRRFGFHGFSHAYASGRAAELLGRPVRELKIVTAHLGAGASLCAVDDGRSVATTMGFTPLEGLVMATRSGSVDPGLLFWVQRHSELSPDEIEYALAHEAGLAGLSGTSGEMREVLAGLDRGDEASQLAFDVYCRHLAAGVATMTAALGQIDALVFTGGVGENCPEVRQEAARRMSFLGIQLDADSNRRAAADAIVSAADAPTSVLVVSAREDLEIAQAARAALTGKSADRTR